ncbi:hypothetical protein M0R45_015308 [Rubus argutus]|uniref:Uncharacterized protein n=1 Tax=Rubus argutus TaxID=59490 RepID=A0AAW1XRN4_RUBAR
MPREREIDDVRAEMTQVVEKPAVWLGGAASWIGVEEIEMPAEARRSGCGSGVKEMVRLATSSTVRETHGLGGLCAAWAESKVVVGGLGSTPWRSGSMESTARSTGSVSLAAASLVSGSSWIDAGLRVSRSVQVGSATTACSVELTAWSGLVLSLRRRAVAAW